VYPTLRLAGKTELVSSDWLILSMHTFIFVQTEGKSRYLRSVNVFDTLPTKKKKETKKVIFVK